MDGIRGGIVPGDLNPDPTGTNSGRHAPKGGLQQYQDDLDTHKRDIASDEIGNDPSATSTMPRGILAQELHQEDSTRLEHDNDDLRGHIEDLEEGGKERSLTPWRV